MQFPERGPIEAVEEGRRLMPLFDARGLIPAILTVKVQAASPCSSPALLWSVG